MTTKSLRKQLMAAIATLLVAAVALGSSTFAWFVNNTAVEAKQVQVSATAANTLLISPNTETKSWGTIFDFNGDTTDPEKLESLVPVSTIGSKTAAGVSTDALAFFKSSTWVTDATDNGSYNASGFADALTTEYFKKDFVIKAGQACKLYLDDATKFTVASGDMAKSLRLALVVKGAGAASYDGVYMYQIDNILGNNYATTATTLNVETARVDGIKSAIATTSTATAISAKNFVKTDGITKFVSGTGANLAKTPTDGKGMTDAVNDADVLYQFAAADDTVTITAYIWMEGCDFDCNSSVVKSITESVNAVTATLGFCAGAI